MENINAKITITDNKHFIIIENDHDIITFPISDDKPVEVKSAFNKLINLIKHKEFQIKLENVESDLYSQVANEYIAQLNREIIEVRDEMNAYGLLNPVDNLDSDYEF